jgi:hypothetical protein
MKNKSFGDSGMWSLEEYVTPNYQTEFEEEYAEESEKGYIEDYDSHHAANPCPQEVYHSDDSIEIVVDMGKLFKSPGGASLAGLRPPDGSPLFVVATLLLLLSGRLEAIQNSFILCYIYLAFHC